MPAARKSTKSSPTKKEAPKSSRSKAALAKDEKRKPEKKLYKREEDLGVYIYRVLKQVHPETGIGK